MHPARLLTVSPSMHCAGGSPCQGGLPCQGGGVVSQHALRHSSRMCTTRLPNVCVLVATTRCQYQVNKFEQVSSDDHQMSVTGGGSPGLMFGVPYHVSYPMMHVIIPPPTPMNIYACENIAFLQLRLRAVITWWARVCVCALKTAFVKYILVFSGKNRKVFHGSHCNVQKNL